MRSPTKLGLLDRIPGPLLLLISILFIWFIANGDLVESLWTTGWDGRSASNLFRQVWPSLLLTTLVLGGLIFLANLDRVWKLLAIVLASMLRVRGEDRRLTAYRSHVRFENFLGSLKVFCGGLGLTALFVFALLALVTGMEAGLFSEGVIAVAMRFGKCLIFIACLWGLFSPWVNYLEQNGKECFRRKEMLARMEADPDWWRKRDEEQRRRQEEQES